jgi:hypothetical protein
VTEGDHGGTPQLQAAAASIGITLSLPALRAEIHQYDGMLADVKDLVRLLRRIAVTEKTEEDDDAA